MRAHVVLKFLMTLCSGIKKLLGIFVCAVFHASERGAHVCERGHESTFDFYQYYFSARCLVAAIVCVY